MCYYSRKSTPVKSLNTQDKVLQPENFNPNTIQFNDLVRFGLDTVLAKRIGNYRLNGGKFYRKTDMLKIYGMDSSTYAKLEPFIRIPNRKNKVFQSKIKPRYRPEKIDINLADTTDLKRIYGIGSVLSKRIIKFRNRLGGFVGMHQLGEVYGLKDSVLFKIRERFILDSTHIPKLLNINTAGYEELSSHPYINYSTAKLIVGYRDMHGEYASIDDLKNIHTMNDSIFQKLKPYITN